MKIGLIVIGKTDAGYFVEAINEYKNRLTHYIPFEMEVIPDIKNVKNLSEAQQKEKEGELILKALQPGHGVPRLPDRAMTPSRMPTLGKTENVALDVMARFMRAGSMPMARPAR